MSTRESRETATGRGDGGVDGQPSLGALLLDVTGDVQRLFRQEIELAKLEIRKEAANAGKAAGMLGGSGFAGYMVAVLLSLAAVFGLAILVGLALSALVVAGAWGLVGGVLFLMGRARMKTISPRPDQTIETIKEDARWARHRSR